MNLIFCSLDTLRADRLSCLGHSRGLTPNLDRIASEGALFSQAFATDIPTQPSHTALFTGTVRGQHGHRLPLPSRLLPGRGDAVAPLADCDGNGYTTGAVDHLFAMKDWFIRGYDDYMPPPGPIAVPGFGDQRDRLPMDRRPCRRGLLPLPPLLGCPHPLSATVAVQGAIHLPDGGPHRPGLITEKLEGRPSYPALQAEPVRLPRLDAQPRLHRRPL